MPSEPLRRAEDRASVIEGWWSRVVVDDARCLVYGPRFGRLYLLEAEQALAAPLQNVLGRRSLTLCSELADPAQLILENSATLSELPMARASLSLRFAYRFLDWSRRFLPFAAMSRALRRLALRRHSRARLGVREIARLVHCIERSVPNPNCYPRALLTSYLCVQSGLPCDIVIGVLAPARLMHAWCSTRGQLPYEARPEHYMYQPLFVLRLSE